MTMTEYNKRKKCGDDTIIKVWDHKTVGYYGAAIVVLTPESFKLLQIYITIMRKSLNKKSDNVFLSWSGRSIVSGNTSSFFD